MVVNFRRTRARCARIRASSKSTCHIGQVWASVGRFRAKVGRFRAKVDRRWWLWGGQIGRSRAQFGRTRCDSAHTRSESAPNLFDSVPNWPMRAEASESWPDFGRFRPHLGQTWECSTGSGPIWGRHGLRSKTLHALTWKTNSATQRAACMPKFFPSCQSAQGRWLGGPILVMPGFGGISDTPGRQRSLFADGRQVQQVATRRRG